MGLETRLRTTAGVLTVAAFICVVLVGVSTNLRDQRTNLIQGGYLSTPVHSEGYYEALAQADAWQAGPRAASSSLKLARTQDLTEVRPNLQTSLVKACAGGDNDACTKIASNPKQLIALEKADTQPRHSQAKVLPPRAAHRRQGVTSASSSADSLWDTNNGMWDSKQWQSGDVADAVSSQWLAACTDGDWDACKHISQSNNALSQLLDATTKAGGEPLANYMAPKRVPAPVFVPARKPQEKDDSWFGQILGSMGLEDNFYGSGVSKAREPAKMVPDVGLLGKGSKAAAVWNDGTVALGLSDDKSPEEAARQVKKHITSSLSTIFSDSAGEAPSAVNYH